MNEPDQTPSLAEGTETRHTKGPDPAMRAGIMQESPQGGLQDLLSFAGSPRLCTTYEDEEMAPVSFLALTPSHLVPAPPSPNLLIFSPSLPTSAIW